MENNQTTSGAGQHEVSGSARQNITPFLWFNGRTKEALEFYTSTFKNSKIVNMQEIPTPNGTIVTGTFQLDGVEFMALDGGPHFNFTPAVSFFVKCRTQEEVDHLWNTLSEGGQEEMCGWLRDKFGVSWQIIPDALGKLMGDPNPVKSGNVMQAMLKMRKLIIKDLQAAYDKE